MDILRETISGTPVDETSTEANSHNITNSNSSSMDILRETISGTPVDETSTEANSHNITNLTFYKLEEYRVDVVTELSNMLIIQRSQDYKILPVTILFELICTGDNQDE